MPPAVVALSKDWDDDPTSNHHVLRELARTRRVLWLNSVAARSPYLSDGRDLRRAARKLREFARGPVNVENDLWVFTPLVVPLPHIGAVQRLNGRVMRATLRFLRARLRLADFQLWTFLPNAAPYVGVGESLSVYYCVDEHSMFSSLDSAHTAAAERELLERIDLVFAINEPLADLKRAVNPETHLALHGVDHARFAAALDPETRAPDDVARLPHPVLGFYGALQDWVDFELLAEIARRRPDWSIVLIGQEQSDTSAVRGLSNVHLLGRRRNDELPAYCKAFDVALIPYRISEQLVFRNPIKLREYLSAGLPVVSTPIPEVHRYERWCATAGDPAAFVQSVVAALADDTRELREERSRAMQDETWAARVAEIDRTVTAVTRRRQAPRTTGRKRDMTQQTTTQARFRAGMVGAGKICQFHVAAVQALPDVELVGVTDLDASRAERAAAEWGTTAYPSTQALVEAGANVIHVLTPPHTHAAVALEALELGCHVLVEKPLAESPEDARRIGEVARAERLVATVDHSLLYDPQVMIALDRVRAGALGDIVAVDIFQSSEYPPYEGGQLPPQYRDPAYPWRDIGVHCIYLIQELLGTIEDVEAEWSSLGGDRNLAFDEWRALVRCERGLGQFHLSWNVRPQQSQLIIQGTRGVTRVDLFAMFQGRRAATPLPKAAERVLNAYKESLRPLVEVPSSVWKFVRKEIQPFQGLRNLVGDFYTRLAAGDPPPVSIEDAAVTVEWIEKVARAAEAEHAQQLSSFASPPETTAFLVTGASGSVGSAVVERLLGEGRQVRALVRHIPDHPTAGVDYVIGNLGDPEAIDRAVGGAERIIHAGAAMSGGWPEHLGSTVVGTRNIIEAARRHGVRQTVYISSMSVVDMAGAAGNGPVSEATPLEPRAEERGAYTQAKLQAELEVTAAAQAGLPCVILRPGVIFGGGIPLMNGSVARRAGGRWVILGDGRLVLPLVYMDDVVDAIVAAVDRDLVTGEVIQLIDREQLTQSEVLAAVNGDEKPLRVPRPVVFGLGKLSEYPLGALGRPSPLAVYRLKSALARLTYESHRGEQLLGWEPRVGVREGIRRETA